jgi:hypothetical protein
LSGLQNSLSGLVSARQTILSSTTGNVVGGTPDIRTVDLPDRGTLASRHLTEFALLALVAGILVAIELSYFIANVSNRRRRAAATSDVYSPTGDVPVSTAVRDSREQSIYGSRT